MKQTGSSRSLTRREQLQPASARIEIVRKSKENCQEDAYNRRMIVYLCRSSPTVNPHFMAKSLEVPTPDELNKIINGTSFNGDITSNGDFRIDGTLKGSLSSKGKLVVGPTGNIEGEVRCKNAEIFGKITAKLFVEELLSLRSTAELSGEVVYNKIAIEAGAKLVGTLTIKDQLNPNITRPNIEKPQEEKR
jgi:cytoskeletal protein CcmA (bactofilin family)